jgi:toxin ParE1/3/4
MRIRFTPRARDDLVEIHAYIAMENPAAARRVVAAIREQITLLVQHPMAGRRGQIPDTRELVISRYPYLVAYRVNHDVVEVLSIWHTARDLP